MNLKNKFNPFTDKLKWTNILYFCFFLLCISVLTIIFGLEYYNVAVIIFLTALSILFFVEPFWGLVIILVITVGIEGKLLEEFILFRLFNFNWYLTDFVFFLFIISILPRVFSGEYKIYINNILVWILTFLSFSLLSVLWGMKMGHSFTAIFHDLRGFFPYILFLPTYWVMKGGKKLKLIFIIFLIIGSLKCLIDINLSIFYLKKTFDASSRQLLNFARLTGYSEIIYPTILIASITYFLIEKSLKIRLLLIPSILLSSAALFLSYTRGSWLAFFVSLVVLIIILSFMDRKSFKLSYVFYFFPLIFFMMWIMDLSGIFPFREFIIRITSVSASKIDVSNLGRLVEWATALESFVKHPFLGGGFGLMYSYIAPGIGYKSTTFTHNSYLYVLSKMGILGFVPFVMILFANFKVLIKIVKKKSFASESDKIIFTFLIVLLLISIKSFTTWHLNTWTFSMFIGMLFGFSYDYKVKEKLDR